MAKGKNKRQKKPLPANSGKSRTPFKCPKGKSSKMSIEAKIGIVSIIVAIIIAVIGWAFNSKAEEIAVINDNHGVINLGNIYGETPLNLSQGNAYYEQGQELFRICDYESALEQYNNALTEFESLSHVDADVARIQCSIGLTYKRQGNLGAAIQWYTKALGTLKSLSGSEETDSVQGYVFYLRGLAYLESRDLERALPDCNNCLTFAKKSYFYGECTYASALCLQGRIYSASYYGTHSPYPVHGGTDLDVTWLDAMKCFDTALEFNGARLRSDGGTGFPSGTIAVKAFKYTEFDGITYEFTPNIKFSLGPSYYVLEKPDAETAAILNCRAALMMMAGMRYLNEVIANCEAVLQIYSSLPPDEREGIQNTYFYLAQAKLLKETRKSEGAIDDIDAKTAESYCQLMEKALEYTKKWCGESKDTAIAYENMGVAYMTAMNHEAARENFQEAIRLFSKLGLDEDVQKQEGFIEILEGTKGIDGKWSIMKMENQGKVKTAD